MARQVIGPDILEKRQIFMQGKSAWYFIDLLNTQLKTGIVNSNGTVTVIIQYNIKEHTANQIVSFYIDAGWLDVTIIWEGPGDSIYGATQFIFTAPIAILLNVNDYVQSHLSSNTIAMTTSTPITEATLAAALRDYKIHFNGSLELDMILSETPSTITLNVIEQENNMKYERLHNNVFSFDKEAIVLCAFGFNLSADSSTEKLWIWVEEENENGEWKVIRDSARYIEYTPLTEGSRASTILLKVNPENNIRFRQATESGTAYFKSKRHTFGNVTVGVPSLSLKIAQID